MHLDKSEFFITLIFQNFRKKCNIMIISQISFYACYNGASPFNNKRFEAILLIQISIHVLFHGLDRKFRPTAFRIKLLFMKINVINYVLKLFYRQYFLSMRITYALTCINIWMFHLFT
jgi:hypothetical protein